MRPLRHLVLVLGDQLDLEASAFDGFDDQRDSVWMAEARDKTNVSILTIRDHPRQGLEVLISWSPKLPSLYLKDGLPRTVSIVIDGVEGVTELPIIQADDIKDPTLTSRAIFLQREKWLLNAIEKGKELRVEIPLEGLGKETFIFPIDKFDRKRIKR